MKRLLLASAAALGLMTGIAAAQTTETITATTPGAVVSPPPGTLSTNITKESVGPDGSVGYSQSTTYNNGTGGTTTQTKSTTYPAAPPPPPSGTVIITTPR
jgi:hypothetical protein